MIGLLIEAYMRLHSISVRDMANSLNVSAATICRIKSGHPVDQQTMLQLINWLFSKDKGDG